MTETTNSATLNPGEAARRQEIIGIVLVLLIAAAIRVVYIVQYRAHVPYYSAPMVDSAYYDAWAWRVAQGHGYGHMPFYMAPLYPYALAAVYLVVGHNPAAVYVPQMILGLVNLALTYLLARRLFGHTVGLVAMLLMTAYSPLVYLETKLLTETLAIALNLGSLLFLLGVLRRPAGWRFLAAGVMLGLSVVCRPSALVTVGIIVIWVLVLWVRTKRPTGAHAVALVLGIMLAILPVTARNYFVGHDFAPLTTNGGLVFAQANHPGANGVSTAILGFSGSIMDQQDEEMEFASRALGHPVKPSESSSFWLHRGLRFIREQPGEFARLIGLKVVWCLHNTEADCSYNVYLEETLVPVLRFLALPFAVLMGLAVFGFAAGRRVGDARGFTLLSLYAASIFMGLIVFAVTSRYRAPVIPALCIFAAYGLVRGAEAITGRRVREVLSVVASIGAFVMISLVPYPIPRITATSLANLGANYVDVGQVDRGLAVMKKSLAMDPQQEGLYGNLGRALMMQGRDDEAIAVFTRGLRIAPDRPATHNGLGFALLDTGDAPRAEREFRTAIRLKPGFVEAHLGLANALLRLHRRREAEQERRTAGRYGPDLARAHFEVGNLLDSQGDYDEAVRQFREAIRLKSDFADAYVGLGLTLKAQSKLPEAILRFREAIRIEPGLVRAHNNLAIALYFQKEYAEAWKEVHISMKHGGKPHPGFLRALYGKMPDPGP